jgi:hypothetical protein
VETLVIGTASADYGVFPLCARSAVFNCRLTLEIPVLPLFLAKNWIGKWKTVFLTKLFLSQGITNLDPKNTGTERYFITSMFSRGYELTTIAT